MRHSDTRWLFVIVLLGVATAARAQLSEADVLADLTQTALERNLSVAETEAGLRSDRAAFDAARLGFRPRMSLDARFTRAGGGRTIELPLGDLLNPVYGALGQVTGQPGAFPTLDNQWIPFLRDQEQETKLRLVQPIYQPRLTAAIGARRAQVEASESELEAVRASVTRDVATAYFAYRRAEQGVAILLAARTLVDENLRVAERRLSAGDALRADVLRAQAETFAVAGDQAAAMRDLDLSRSALNVLLDRPLDTPIPEAEATAYVLPDDQSALVERQALAVARRAELDQLSAAIRASESAVELARADLRPSVALALDAGVQGRGYVPDDDGPFYLASVVASWTLWGGGAERAETRQAQADSGARPRWARPRRAADSVAGPAGVGRRPGRARAAAGNRAARRRRRAKLSA